MEINGHSSRILTEEEIEKLRQDNEFVPEFRRNKLEMEADKNWDKFYKRNGTNFFKDRHWTEAEFTQICPDVDWQNSLYILEAGCGVGNLLFPMMDMFPKIFVYACDFSPRAVNFIKENEKYDSNRCCPFVCDLTEENGLLSNVQLNSIDICTLIFVLSAVHPEKMSLILTNIYKVLKPGGSVIVRDYGLFDHAMLRFGKGHKLMDNFYVRQDGTRAYYFSEEKLKNLFEQCHFTTLSCNYVEKETVNIKENIRVPRIFVQGRFIKR